MNNEEILMVAESVSNEKDLPKDTIFEAIEIALASAAKKKYSDEVDIRVDIDHQTGDYETFRCWEVVEVDDYETPEMHILIDSDHAEEKNLSLGDLVKEKIENVEFGRIAAQIAKQVIVQKVRDAERLETIKKFRSSLGLLVTGTVKKVTRETIIVDLGEGADAILPRSDLIQGEIYRIGDRVRAILEETVRENRGSQLTLSRGSKEMLVELFKLEVPEIAEEVVQIRAVAREPGGRSKIAVKTNDTRIDPVGACVGMRGARVQAVSNELGNERIDIIVWEDDPAKLLINTLSPAEVTSIVLDEDADKMEVQVKDESLAQAIGRNGQNIRLSSELIGWDIQIRGENEDKESSGSDQASNILEKYLDIDTSTSEILISNGFESVNSIAEAEISKLCEIEESTEEIAETLIERASDALIEIALSDMEEAFDFNSLDDVDEEIAKVLSDNLSSKDELADLSVDELVEMTKIDEELAAKIIMDARSDWFEE